MVELRVKLGAKGQVVIPKILREAYGLYPRQEVIISEKEEGVIIKKPKKDIAKTFLEIDKKVNENKKIKDYSPKELKEIYEEQYEEKARRSGIRI